MLNDNEASPAFPAGTSKDGLSKLELLAGIIAAGLSDSTNSWIENAREAVHLARLILCEVAM